MGFLCKDSVSVACVLPIRLNATSIVISFGDAHDIILINDFCILVSIDEKDYILL